MMEDDDAHTSSSVNDDASATPYPLESMAEEELQFDLDPSLPLLTLPPMPDVMARSEDIAPVLPQKTIQDSVDFDNLAMPPIRLDPEKPFGQTVTAYVIMKYRGVSSEIPLKLSVEDRTRMIGSIIHTMSRLISENEPNWSKERRQFAHYTDMLVKLKDDTYTLLYSYTGVRIPISVYVRTPQELDELWQHYESGDMEREFQELFKSVYMPFGPVEISLKIYDYEECKKKFHFSGYRLLYVQYPELNKKRR